MESKKYRPIVYRIKDYLEKNCVGKENIQTYQEIMHNLVLDDGTMADEKAIEMFHYRFKKIIQLLRTDFDRFICSTSHGYYLPKDASEDSNYMVNQAITHMKTCLAQGTDPRVFYKVLNITPVNDVQDGQLKLKLTPYAKEEVTRYTK